MGIGGFFFVAGVLLVVLSTGRSITAPFGFLGVGEIRAGGEAASTLRLMGLIWAGVGLLNLIIHPIAKRVTVGGHFTAVDPATVLPDPPPAGVAHSLATLAELAQRGLLDAQEWERAKDLLLGKPEDRQAADARQLGLLHDLYRRGGLSESEFNAKKWEILSTREP